jgi:hypothetical protein
MLIPSDYPYFPDIRGIDYLIRRTYNLMEEHHVSSVLRLPLDLCYCSEALAGYCQCVKETSNTEILHIHK